MPAAWTAAKAGGGAREWNCLGCSVPRSVIAVSRLIMAKSAARRVSAIGPKAVVGSLSRARLRSWKFTSPAKASVIVGGGGAAVGDAEGTDETDGAGCGE